MSSFAKAESSAAQYSWSSELGLFLPPFKQYQGLLCTSHYATVWAQGLGFGCMFFACLHFKRVNGAIHKM